MARFYLTTAIDYANGAPHIGHAIEKIGADAIARYHRLRGDDVHFLMGMDEHGQKVAQAAAARGVAPQRLADEVAELFTGTWSRLGISYDQFIRTTDAHHKRGVRALIERIFERNPDDFYEKAYEGWYCVGCEQFKRDNEIEDGKCVLHPTRELQWTHERNWFFRLTRYQPFVRELFERRPGFLLPETRRNEMLALLHAGLEDISITRSRLSWAIPFPRPTSDGVEQGTWVWFDALPNYLTATGFPDSGYEARWPAQLHVIGKDITRLHAVIWPAMLEAAGLPAPEAIFAHGFVTLRGERFSKSAGVQLDLDEAIGRFGPDAFRYFLLREIPFDGDGSFTWERFEERYNADLANAFGNLASRTVAMIERYCAGVTPAPTADDAFSAADAESLAAYERAMDARLLHEALQAVWQLVSRTNELVDRRAPWKLAKDPGARPELEGVLGALARRIALQTVLVAPFMPGKSDELWRSLGASGEASAMRWPRGGGRRDLMWLPQPTGWRVTKGAPLFPKEESAAPSKS